MEGWRGLVTLWLLVLLRSPSSSGLGHRPFKAAARVRTPLGTQDQTALTRSNASCSRGRSPVQHELGERAGAELLPKRHTSSSAQPLRVARVAFVQACSAAAAGRAAPTCSSSNQNLPVAAPPSAGCLKRTRRGHSACSTRFPVDAAERSRWVAVLTCFDRHTKPVQTGSRTAISQTYERRCSRPPDDDRRSVDDAPGAGQHICGCWRHRGEGGLGWERILRKTSHRARPWAGCDQAQVSW
jgi:hypothetical protein